MNRSTVIILAAAASAAALAQNPFAPTLTANVPFAFHQMDMALSAGRYQIKSGPASGTVVIADGSGRNLAVTITSQRSIKAVKTGVLRFNCYDGDNCFLREVLVPGSERSMAIPAGKVETETRRGAGVKVAVVETPLLSARNSAE